MFAKILHFLQPGWVKVAITLMALLLTLLVITNREPTSKVTWEKSLGAPLPFLFVTEYRGPWEGQNFVVRMFVDDFLPKEFALDLVGWYLVSCILLGAYRKVFQLGGKAKSQTGQDIF